MNFIVYFIFFFIKLSFASDFESKSNTEVLYLGNQSLDYDVRFQLVKEAISIDFIAFEQNDNDEIGERFLDAIRIAQVKNHATVRLIFDHTVTAINNGKSSKIKAIVSDPNLTCRGECLCAHPIEKVSSGIGLLDFVHQKLLILNRGTEKEVIIMGSGRSQTLPGSKFIDTSYVFRPMNRFEPYVGDDLQKVFDSIYSVMKQISSKSIIKIPTVSNKGAHTTLKDNIPLYSTSKEEVQMLNEVLNILKTPATVKEEKKLKNFQFQPKSLKVVSNDLFYQLVNEKKVPKINDNILNINRDIKNFNGKINLTSYSFGPPDQMLDELVAFLKRGNTLNIFTNGASAFEKTFNMGYAVSYTFEMAAKLIKLSEGLGRVNLYLLNPDRDGYNNSLEYLHRRMLVFYENGQDFLYVGSDPMTESSRTKNDETLVKIEDKRLVKKMNEVSYSELKDFDLLSYEEILKADGKKPFMYKCLRGMIRKVF